MELLTLAIIILMKTRISKLLALAFLLLMPCAVFSYEYGNDGQCVYRINVAGLTAKVVNFCGDQSTISIPSSFKYLDDVYTVTEFGYDDFKYNEYRYNDIYGDGEKISKYNFIDYDKSRSRIVELIVPKTVTVISRDATKGMTRLQKLTISGNVILDGTSGTCLNLRNSQRLEAITFLGLPKYSWYERTARINEFFYETEGRELRIIDDPKRFIHMMDSVFHAECPSIKNITFSNAMLNNILPYSTKLNDTISLYNDKLRKHPYYFTSKAYKPKVAITKSPTSSEKSTVIAWYNEQLKNVRQQYRNLYDEMETLCRKYAPEKYMATYITKHPEFSAQVDSVYLLCRCVPNIDKNTIALQLLTNQTIEQNCIDKLYRSDGYLFTSKEEFISRYKEYENHENFVDELAARRRTCRFLTKLRDENIKGMANEELDFYQNVVQPAQLFNISKEWIINTNEKMKTEYMKNGHYFNSADEFYEAYIHSGYNQVLKNKKK